MKKTLLIAFAAIFALSMHAQKKGSKNTIELKTKIDSISYALGQSITNGLDQYITTTGILKDTTKATLIENYDVKVANGTKAELDNLEKEYQKKLAETKKTNEEAFKAFLRGVEEAITVDASKKAYYTGVAIGNQLGMTPEAFEKQMLDGDKINKQVFASSAISAIKEEKSIIPDVTNYFKTEMEGLQEVAQRKADKAKEEERAEKIKEEETFLAENKKKSDIVELPSKLQYKVLTMGEGTKPTQDSRVTVHYEGRLLNGTIFDSSYKRGNPATFGVGQVIKGWTEILQLMPKGSKWTVYIPYSLAYGENGSSAAIPPFATLEFDIELIDIEAAN